MPRGVMGPSQATQKRRRREFRRHKLYIDLTSKQVPFDATEGVVVLRSKAREYIKNVEKPWVTKLAEAAGHQVLFTPPYHSDLQPIELVWALVKGGVGRQHNSQTTLQIVYARLMKEFENLESADGMESVRKMVEKCAGNAKKMYDELLEDEGEDGDAGEGDEDNSDDTDSDSDDELEELEAQEHPGTVAV